MAKLHIEVEVGDDPTLVDPNEAAAEILDPEREWRLVSAEWAE